MIEGGYTTLVEALVHAISNIGFLSKVVFSQIIMRRASIGGYR